MKIVHVQFDVPYIKSYKSNSYPQQPTIFPCQTTAWAWLEAGSMAVVRLKKMPKL
jgi:hypothetical protein